MEMPMAIGSLARARGIVAAARSGGGWERTMRYRVSTSLFALIVTGVALWWLLSGPLQAAFADAIHRARLWPLAAAWAMVPVIQGLRAWRFSLLATGRPATPSWPMYVIASRLLLFNFLLPFKLGEVSFPLLMRRAFGTSYVRSTGVLIVARLMDLCVVSAMLVFGAVLVIDPMSRGWHLPVLVGAGVAGLALPLLGIEPLDPVWSCREVGGNWLRRRRFRSARSRGNPRHEGSYASLADAAIAVRRQRLVRSP
jgi:hypothetical protein